VCLLLPAQHIPFEHVLDPKSGQHVDDFTAVVHIVGDDLMAQVEWLGPLLRAQLAAAL
jgi:hypothetical protein